MEPPAARPDQRHSLRRGQRPQRSAPRRHRPAQALTPKDLPRRRKHGVLPCDEGAWPSGRYSRHLGSLVARRIRLERTPLRPSRTSAGLPITGNTQPTRSLGRATTPTMAPEPTAPATLTIAGSRVAALAAWRASERAFVRLIRRGGSDPSFAGDDRRQPKRDSPAYPLAPAGRLESRPPLSPLRLRPRSLTLPLGTGAYDPREARRLLGSVFALVFEPPGIP